MGIYVYPNNTETEITNAYIGIPNPESITLDKSSINLTTVGQTEQLTATIEPTISDHSVTWSSDDTSVATVSTTGLVTCVTPGTATITATTSNGLIATCSVNTGWMPGVNTIAYYPLTSSSTVNDQSGNSYNLTNNGVTFGTYAGVDCAYFANTSGNDYSLYTTDYGLTTDMTVSLWFYQISFPNTYNCQFQFGTGSRGYVLGTWINSSGDICLGAWSSPESIVPGAGTYQGAWHYMVMTKSGTSCELYIDNTLITTLTFSRTVPNRLNLGGQPVDSSDLYGYLSNVIIEDKAWTQQERTDYFNLTKGEYGIS